MELCPFVLLSYIFLFTTCRSLVHWRVDRWPQRCLLCLWDLRWGTLPGGKSDICRWSGSSKKIQCSTLLLRSWNFVNQIPLHSFPDAVLQHASHHVPLLESPSALPWKHLPITPRAAGLPLADSNGSLPHAAAAHLADAVVLLPPGDLRPHGLSPVSRPHVGVSAQPAAGVPCLDGPRPPVSWQWKERLSLLTVIALWHHTFHCARFLTDIFCRLCPPSPQFSHAAPASSLSLSLFLFHHSYFTGKETLTIPFPR